MYQLAPPSRSRWGGCCCKPVRSTQTRETAEDKGQAGTCSQSESQAASVVAEGETFTSCGRKADHAQTLSDGTSKKMSSQPRQRQRLMPRSAPRQRDVVTGRGGVPKDVPAFRSIMHNAALTLPLCRPPVFDALGCKPRTGLATAPGHSLLKVFEEAPNSSPERLCHFPPPPATRELGDSFDFPRGATRPPLWATWPRSLTAPRHLWPTSGRQRGCFRDSARPGPCQGDAARNLERPPDLRFYVFRQFEWSFLSLVTESSVCAKMCLFKISHLGGLSPLGVLCVLNAESPVGTATRPHSS